jgi:hypothetical protein
MVMVIITATITVIGRGTIGATTIGAIMVGAGVIVKNWFELKPFQGYVVFRGFCLMTEAPQLSALLE